MDTEIFVNAQTGDDNNTGVKDSPVKSLEKARELVIRLKESGFKNDIHVKISGRFSLLNTFVLGTSDGAKDGQNIIYEADGDCLITSDVKIEGWVQTDDIPNLPDDAKGKVFAADVPDGYRFYRLFEGDSPLENSSVDFTVDTSHVANKKLGSQAGLYGQHMFVPDEIMDIIEREKAEGRLKDLEIAAYPRQKWMYSIFRIKDTQPGYFSTTVVAKKNNQTGVQNIEPIDGYNWVLLDRYLESGITTSTIKQKGIRLLNAVSCLKQGQWCIDTARNKVYIWPSNGLPPMNINAPRLTEYFKVEGKVVTDDTNTTSDVLAGGIQFKNLNFSKSDRSIQSPDDAVSHSEFEIYDKNNAVIRFRGAEKCIVDGVKIFSTGSNAIRMDLSSRYITVKNSKIFDIGKTAIAIIGYGPGTKDVNHHHTIENNEIYNVGVIDRLGHAISVCQTHHVTIKHNKIYNTPFNAISVATFRYWRGVKLENYSREQASKTKEERLSQLEFTPEYKAVRLNELPTFTKGVLESGTAFHQNKYILYVFTDYINIFNNEMFNVANELGDSNAVYVNTSKNNVKVCYNFIHDITNKEGNTALRSDGIQKQCDFSYNILYRLRNLGGITHSNKTCVNGNYIVENYGQFTIKMHSSSVNSSTVTNNVCCNGKQTLDRAILPMSLNYFKANNFYQHYLQDSLMSSCNVYDARNVNGVSMSNDEFIKYMEDNEPFQLRGKSIPITAVPARLAGETDQVYYDRLRKRYTNKTVDWLIKNINTTCWKKIDMVSIFPERGDEALKAFKGELFEFILTNEVKAKGIKQLNVKDMGLYNKISTEPVANSVSIDEDSLGFIEESNMMD